MDEHLLPSNAVDRAARHVLSPAKLRRVCEFVRAHLAAGIDLDTLAGVAGLSRYHFSRVFTQTAGYSPYAYVINQRIEVAKTLLHDSELTLSEIASHTGFKSVAQLSAMFRRQTGMTSNKYRNSLPGAVPGTGGIAFRENPSVNNSEHAAQ